MTPHGPAQQNSPRTTAQSGPAFIANRRRRKRKPSARRKPKNGNTVRGKAPRANLQRRTCQRERGLHLQKGNLEDPAPLQISVGRHHRDDRSPSCLSETPDPIQDPTHPVDPDQGEDQGLIQDLEVSLDHKAGLYRDPDLSHTLDHGQGLDHGTDQDPHPGREVHQDPRGKEKRGNRKQTSQSTQERSSSMEKSKRSPDYLLCLPLKASQ